MNDYRIAFTSETGEESTGYITERSESSARKAFNANHKGMGFTIQSVELHRENTCATKQQERDTLETIKKMVAELGPQSYLATAFDGCFEDAENNIENDFADSMKARWLHADAQLNAANDTIEELKEQLAESQKDCEAADGAAHAIAEEKDVEIAALRERVLSPDDLESVQALVYEQQATYSEELKKAAERIVENAGEPESEAFQSAVSDHRAAKRAGEKFSALAERLSALKG